MTNTKAIIFDVGGVLSLETNSIGVDGKIRTKGVHSFVAKKLGISLDQYFDAIDTYYAKAIEGKRSPKELIHQISKNLKIKPKKLEKTYIKAYKKYFKQNKELFKFAFKLKKQKYKIAILSDQWYLSKKALMPKNLYKQFDEVIVSCDVGIRKPNPEIYKLVLRKLGIKPEQALFIDNQEWNIQPAKKLGMKTILFKNNEQLFKNKFWRSFFK